MFFTEVIITVIIFLFVLILISWPVGNYIARVFTGQKTCLDKIALPSAKLIWRIAGIDATTEMNWRQYTKSLLLFNFVGLLLVMFIQMLQHKLPLNPADMADVSWLLAFNTAVSFVTNTNWQAYAGETTMSYFTQMAALTVQNFLSAATGMTVAIALIRGLLNRQSENLGNFWQDVTRAVLWVLLPLACILALVLCQQGVIQNLQSYLSIDTLQGLKQILPMGPVALQEAIKMLGVNGGGYFNANSAHPFENPTSLTNILQIFAILLIPCALQFTFVKMIKDRKQLVVLGTMIILFVIMLAGLSWSQIYGNPMLDKLGIVGSSTLEGQEYRFGNTGTSLFASVTTAASCGAVNAMHDSLTPIAGMVAMLQMMLGEVIFGGIGAGFYGMMLFVFATVFKVGLMVGRTPEYLGKKIEATEMKMVVLAILLPSVAILGFSALAISCKAGLTAIANNGPHGLSEILYAFASSAGNNGSAFAGLAANNDFYNLFTAIAMLVGRFGVIIPVMVIAGSLASKKYIMPSVGTFNTGSILFMLLLTVVVLLVGALTFIPALVLGPVSEHLQMLSGKMW